MEHEPLLGPFCLGAVRERMRRLPNFSSSDFFAVLKKPFPLVHVGLNSWAGGIGMIGATGSKSQGPKKYC